MAGITNAQLWAGSGAAADRFDVYTPDTYEEYWSGQIIQSSTATVAVLPTVVGVVGNSTVTLPASSANQLWSVSKNGTGNYVLTLVHSLSRVKSITAALQTASATGKVVIVEAPNLANQSVQFQVQTASSGAAVNLSSGDSIHFAIEISGDDSQTLLGNP
jgi:hypothetical protein